MAARGYSVTVTFAVADAGRALDAYDAVSHALSDLPQGITAQWSDVDPNVEQPTVGDVACCPSCGYGDLATEVCPNTAGSASPCCLDCCGEEH